MLDKVNKNINKTKTHFGSDIKYRFLEKIRGAGENFSNLPEKGFILQLTSSFSKTVKKPRQGVLLTVLGGQA